MKCEDWHSAWYNRLLLRAEANRYRIFRHAAFRQCHATMLALLCMARKNVFDYLLPDEPGACASLLVTLPKVPHGQPEWNLHGTSE